MENSNYKTKILRHLIYLNTSYDLLINYIPEPIRKIIAGFNNKDISFFKANTPKDMVNKSGMREERN